MKNPLRKARNTVREFFLVAKMKKRRNARKRITQTENPLLALRSTNTGVRKQAEINSLISCLGATINNRTQFVSSAEALHLAKSEIQEIWPYFKSALKIRNKQ